MDIFTCLFVFILILLVFIYYKGTQHYGYWKKQNVPYKKPTFFFGNYGKYITMQEHLGETAGKLCKTFPNSPYVGAYYGLEPTLIVQDPEVLKVILTKDFYYFSNRDSEKYNHKELILQVLFLTGGDRWRVTRQSLTPVFSSAKMKNMFYLLENCGNSFENCLEKEYKMSEVLNIREIMGRFTMECLGSCVFGVETKTMEDDSNNIFRKIASSMLEVSYVRGLSIMGRNVYPAIFYALGFKVFPKIIQNFFFELLKNIFEARNYKDSGRNDFVDLLLNLKKNDHITGDSMINYKDHGNKKISLKVDDTFLTVQLMSIFAAGFDTSATTLSFTLYELAKNKDAQRKAIEEVDEYLKKHNNKVGYECLTELQYLNACVDETIRLYPVLVVVTREVVEDYNLNGVELRKGVKIHIPVFHIHRRADFFPEPEKYCPERFLPENRHLIQPYTYLPFGEGPRICIGMRFAKMQVLVGLVTALKTFQFELADGMPINITIDPRPLGTYAVEGIHLKAIPRPDAETRKFSK